MAAGSRRFPEIDWLKGFAILCVLLIHTQPLIGTLVHEYLVNRAVPMFIVLFGATSELWWRGRHASTGLIVRAWMSSRLRRLMIPVWGTLVVWWTISVLFDPATPVSPSVVAATALGYMPWVGTGWFVTLVLQLVVLFPLLRVAVDRLGIVICLAATLALTIWSHLHSLEIIGWMRWLLHDSAPVSGFFSFYYFWIFAPTHFFSIVAGIALARRYAAETARDQPHARTRELALWAVVLAAGFTARAYAPGPFWKSAIHATLDAPLTAFMLIAITVVAAWPAAARALAWCGAASWGIYLGQLLVFTTLKTFKFQVETAPIPMRWLYFGVLLGGAIALVTVGEMIKSARPIAGLLRHPRSVAG